ncbi:YegP family protein [Arthrobacter sp. KN11-1C]|uniref:YegP family protein n=1 Tax=Arthrobacter sp. KN11-1C TaxID=3445774 RepID=UPI003FA13871
MAGKFELFVDAGERYRFRLKAADGTVMAVSKDFESKRAAVAGIREVRACAGMGLITDLCPVQPAASGTAPETSAPALAEEGPPRGRNWLGRTIVVRRRGHKAPASKRWLSPVK